MTIQAKQIVHIGVLALQGSFSDHISVLQSLNLPHYILSLTPIRTSSDLSKISALIIPGGESTSISLLIQNSGLLEPLKEFVREAKEGRNKAVWGTCAGMIMISEEVVGVKGDWRGLGGMDVKVVRNQFGRQAESFSCDLMIPNLRDPDTPFAATFIRAPIIHSLLPPLSPSSSSPTLQVLARLPPSHLPKAPQGQALGPNADVVLLRQGNLLMSSFHPELGEDERVHRWWVEGVVIPSLEGGEMVSKREV